MESNGKIECEKVDIMMYYGLSDMASNNRKQIDEELIPTFIIAEALNYFCELEKYEICQNIKDYFQSHPAYMVQSTRDEWYGVSTNKKQKH